MANKSEELLLSMLVPPYPWTYIKLCIKEKAYGTIFCYFTLPLCFLLGTAANSWCLWFYFSVDWKNKQTQVFLLNYIIMELMLCIECAIETLNVFIFNNNKLLSLAFFIFGVSWTGRPLIQTCICIEQYIAVIHPVTFLRYKGIKYRIPVIASAWLMAFGCGLYYIYASNNYIFSYFVFFMAVTVISFCCVSVLRALKQPGPGDTHITKQTGRDVGNQQRKNAFNTILSALLIILLTYLPQVLLFIFAVIKIDDILLECNIIPIVTSINVFDVMITPFMNIYKEGQLKCATIQRKLKRFHEWNLWDS